MESNMFCYQCQETAKGTGCILKGVCGKESHTAQAMDLLLFVVRGISVVADTLRKADCPVSEEVNVFVTDALFCTITNANFDDESILKRGNSGQAAFHHVYRRLLPCLQSVSIILPYLSSHGR